jgi:hypothetical protein
MKLLLNNGTRKVLLMAFGIHNRGPPRCRITAPLEIATLPLINPLYFDQSVVLAGGNQKLEEEIICQL